MTLRPEWNLLLNCARLCSEDERAERLACVLCQTISWDLLLKIAAQQGMTPQLAHCLQRHTLPGMPEDAKRRLQMQSRANAMRNQLLLEELSTLLALFRAQAIPAIPYKGPALAAAVYGDLARRACGDLDILLHPSDVLRAKALLLEAEYQPLQKFQSRREEQQHLLSDCEYNFQRAADGILVELHWRFRPQFFPLPLDMDRLWARAQPLHLGGVETLTLAPPDLLLILSVHGAKHCWERLSWVCDIAQLLQAFPALDGDLVRRQAKALGCERVLLLGTTLAHDLLGAVPPEAFLKDVPSVIRTLAAQVRRQLMAGRDEKSDTLARAQFHLRVRDRLQDRLPYVKHRIQRQMADWNASHTVAEGNADHTGKGVKP